MVPRHQQLEIRPFQAVQRVAVGVNDVVLGLLIAEDIEDALTLYGKQGSPVFVFRIEQPNQFLTALFVVVLSGLQFLGLDVLLKAWIESQAGYNHTFDGQAQQPKCRLREAENTEGSD